MGPEDATPNIYCPHCRHLDQLARADNVDIALPTYELWSALLIVAIGLLLLSAIATSGSAGTPADEGNDLAGALMLTAFALGAVGLARTRRNMSRMHTAEPHVRHYHQRALYCGNCARIHFGPGELPPGIDSRTTWTVEEYRRELWYACGFAK